MPNPGTYQSVPQARARALGATLLRGNKCDGDARLEAQKAVDHLSDSGFPVEQVAIVGRDLRLVEQVIGRLTSTRATLMGAGSGATKDNSQRAAQLLSSVG